MDPQRCDRRLQDSSALLMEIAAAPNPKVAKKQWVAQDYFPAQQVATLIQVAAPEHFPETRRRLSEAALMFVQSAGRQQPETIIVATDPHLALLIHLVGWQAPAADRPSKT